MKNQSKIFILTCIIFSLCVSFLLQCSHRMSQADNSSYNQDNNVIEASNSPDASGE